MNGRIFAVVAALLAVSALGLAQDPAGPGPSTLMRPVFPRKKAGKIAAAKMAKAKLPTILGKAQTSGKQVTYSAIRVVDSANGRTKERIVVAPGQLRIERGQNIIIQVTGQRTVYNKATNVLRRIDTGPGAVGADALVDSVPASSTITVSAGQLMEGRTVDQVEITPFPGQPNKRELWIDEQTGVVMAAKVNRDPTQPTIGYHLETVDFNYHPGPKDFATNFPGAKVVLPREDLAMVSKVTKLPPFTIPDGTNGFALVRVEKRNLANLTVLHETFRAGKKVISMFVMGQAPSTDKLKIEAGNQHFTVMQRDKISVVLIGNVPQPELEELKLHVTK